MVKWVVLFLILSGAGLYILFSYSPSSDLNDTVSSANSIGDREETLPQRVFREDFNQEGVLEEVGGMEGSENPYWWVSSGGRLILTGGLGKTIQGDLPLESDWRRRYAEYNSDSTDFGVHPQNIFRLVGRSKWANARQGVYFRIVQNNLSKSSRRDRSNGVLLLNRYRDSDNLYYAGLRVDGAAVIKKKLAGKYFTMNYEKVVSGTYDRGGNPSLLPTGRWIGIKVEAVNETRDTVSIRLLVDWNRNGNWELVASAKDDGKKYGGKAFVPGGYGGIRTDFMDVEFEDYKIEEIGGE